MKIKGLSKEIIYSIGGIIATLAVTLTAINVNTTCLFYAHQPKLPNSSKKFRKF